MIPDSIIKQIIRKLSKELGIKIIRANQEGDHPRYPFASYNMTISNNENPYQDIKEIEEVPGDPTSVNIIKYEKSEEIFSMNFHDKNRVSRLKTLATDALRWFKSIDGIEFIKSKRVVARLISPSVEDRTVYQEAFYENRYGFDVRFDYSGYTETEIENIDELNIGVTRDGVPQDDLVVNIP